MNITSVAVDGVGKFGVRNEIVGLGPGVNILAAGNEAGKSTIFRAVRACLFERHNTKNEIVRSLATEGLSLPVTVTLAFEHDGQSYKITKSFIKSPTASLVRGTTEIARGREADEMIWELLGIAPGTGRSVDEAAFGILWVEQGQSFRVPEPSEAATTTLNSAIHAEVGALVGGERARTVLFDLKAALASLVTDTGRPKAGGPLAAATMRHETLGDDLEAAERRLALLESQLVELAAKRNDRDRQGDPALLAKMEADQSAAKNDLKSGEAAAALLFQFEAAEQHSKVVLDHAEKALSDLEERGARIETNRKRSAELAEALTPIDEQEKKARAAIKSARDEIDELNTQAVKESELELSLQRLSACVTRAAGRSSLVRQQQALEELENRFVKNEAALAGNRATAIVIKSLDKAERELSVLTARLQASAPEVSVELKEGGAGKVLIGDAVLTDSVVRVAVDPLTIQIGDLANVTISAPPAANEGDLRKRSQLQAQLAKLLRDVGAANANELRATYAKRQELEAEASGLQAEIASMGIDGTSVTLAIQRIRTEIEEIDTLVSDELLRAETDSLPTAEEAELRQSDLRIKRDDARRRRQALDGALDAQNKVLADLSGTRGRLDGALVEVMKVLSGDLAVLPDSNRTQIVDEAKVGVHGAREDYRTKAAAMEEQRQKAPSQEEVERRRIRVDRLERSLIGHRSRLDSLEREIANLEGQIQNAGGDGLGEKVKALRDEADLTFREIERHNARVAMLTLLKETIESCYKEQRDRLHAPLRRHLHPFLNDVFPSAELELGDGFSIAGIKRNRSTPETFDRLSAGTQEQIAVLVRLAMGAMISERNQPVPIILDDALVFSDDDQIEQMFDALNRAGQTQQVIVLTCRTRAFAALGGRQLSILPTSIAQT